MINQKNTFVSLAEQLALLNKNSVEVITKLNDAPFITECLHIKILPMIALLKI